MAKVLITPIGTGRRTSDRGYPTAKYKFQDNDKTYETSFVSAALAEHIKVDKIIFIGTAKSMWEEIYRYFTENAGEYVDDDYWIEIAESSSNSGHDKKLVNEKTLKKTMISVDNYLKSINSKSTGGSLPLIIDYGLNENELWKNFSAFMSLTEILNDGDKVYLDITHSFRSIPLFMYLMMEFMQVLGQKEIVLDGLYYGMLEASGEVGYAPIIDLRPLFEISHWIRGTHDFVNYGNGYVISNLLENNYAGSNSIKETSKKIKNISELVNINYLVDLQQQIESLNKLLRYEYKDNSAIRYVTPLIEKFISRFIDIDCASEFQLELSKWYFENKKYGHGYICLVEAVLTKLCEVYNLDIKDFDNRKSVKNEILARRRHQDNVKVLKNLADKYFSINKIRNRIAHASFYNDNNYSFRNDIDQAMTNYNDIKEILNSDDIYKLDEKIPYDT